jgi:hypothetical protein
MSWNLFPIRDFQEYQDQWQHLNMEGVATPLLDKLFVLPLLQEFGTGKEVLACYGHSNQIQAMAILTYKGIGNWETFQPSQAPLGMWLHRPEIDWLQLPSQLIAKLPGFPLVLGITQQDPQFVPRPPTCETRKAIDYIETCKIKVVGNFEDYWDARGKNLRHNMKKQRKNLEKEGIATKLQLTTEPEDVVQAIADYGTLESAGWKANTGTAVHLDNAQGRFYRSMMESFCLRGAGRIYRYLYNDKIVSMILCIERDDTMVMLKMTYDETVKDGSSPTVLLRQEMVEQIFDEGKIKNIEFYGKASMGNLQWTRDVRTLYHLNNYRFPLLARLHSSMRKTAPAVSPAA